MLDSARSLLTVLARDDGPIKTVSPSRQPTWGTAEMWTRLLLLASLLLVSNLSLAQARGDWVLARWKGGDYWFPGVVESRKGDVVVVAYDDGTREKLPLNRVRPYDWRPGSRVQCRWRNGSEWYAGVIKSITDNGVTLNIKYDDGDKETTTTAACRSQ